MLGVMAIGTIVISFSVNRFLTTDNDDWFAKSSLNNKTLTPVTAWMHTLLAVIFSILTFHIVFDLREEARNLYKETTQEKNKVKDNEWLRARTLHVRGLLPKDRRGDMLKNELNMMLKSINGRVLDVVVIPDFQNLFDLEVEKKDLEELHVLTNANGAPKACTRCCIRALWTRSSRTI